LIQTCLTDERFARIEGELTGKAGDPGQTARDNRLFVEAVLWIARTGFPWRDLSAEFGKWFSLHTLFWRWSQKGVWECMFKVLSGGSRF
jgi:transposase